MNGTRPFHKQFVWSDDLADGEVTTMPSVRRRMSENAIQYTDCGRDLLLDVAQQIADLIQFHSLLFLGSAAPIRVSAPEPFKSRDSALASGCRC